MAWRYHTDTGHDATVHVWPESDAIEHDRDTFDCVCGPDLETQGNGAVLVKHHSLDGRERIE